MMLSPILLSDWLSWAGARLIAMPSQRIKPALPRACWPDYTNDKFQVLEFRANLRIRIPPPSKDEIPIVEEILLFPNYCETIDRRRVLHLRLLTNPVTLRPINSWNKISDRLDISPMRAKRTHNLALQEATGKIPPIAVNRISDFFGNLPIF